MKKIPSADRFFIFSSQKPIVFLIVKLNHMKNVTNFPSKESTDAKKFCCFSFDRHCIYCFAVALLGNGHNKNELFEFVIDVRIDFLGILKFKIYTVSWIQSQKFCQDVE